MGNEGFVSKAYGEVIEAEKAKLAELAGQLTTIMEQLKALVIESAVTIVMAFFTSLVSLLHISSLYYD
ncbi:hypothetical protein [Psychrobacter sp. JB385]|uniref:hypothetical protein n=1 Tax=Psychrobacter sp. JB385 TaxID=1434841 RepID=UPI00097EAD2A|nr:hypothetical protein [Psychrobacter sp. JB385]SJN15471.1 Valyl-tRNA synthetase [Psychrobacter sp. JB385]